MKKTSKTAWKVYGRLLSYAKKYWSIFVFGIIGTIILSLLDAGFTWMIKPIINRGFINRETAFIKWLPLLLVFVFAVRGVAGFCSNYFIGRVARNVIMDLRKAIFDHLLKLPAKFYDKNSSGNILSTIVYNVEQVAQASSDVLITLLREASLLIGLIVVMFTINWELSLMFLTVAPIIGYGVNIASKRLRKLSTRVQNAVGRVTHIANEGIEAYKVVRLFGGQGYEAKKFFKAINQNRQQELKVIVTNSIGTSMIQVLISIPIAIVLYLATQPSMAVSAGSFAAVAAAMIMLLRPMRRMTNVNSYVQKGISAADSIFELLDKESEKDSGTEQFLSVRGEIVFDRVNFSYASSDRPVLKDISFKVHHGQTVAIVGRSGSGKSTLINLLPRFYELESGQITIDGVDINSVRLPSLRNQFSLVSQHTALFNDTIAKNIAYAQGDDIDEARLRKAAENANALEFIEKLPDGFDTVVGEDGLLLSGGQRQRLAIARALFKQAPILILDEATSALDTHAERQIQAAFDNLMKRCTTLVIAHRLSTIENADWIIVMDDGQVVETGTHDDLLVKQGAYARLHRMQFSEGVAAPV